jgi:hypothetical protein
VESNWVNSALRPPIRLLCRPGWIWWWRNSGMMIGRGNRSTERKPAPVPLYPPQIPHAARTRTRAAAVGSQLLTAWATARPLGCLITQAFNCPLPISGLRVQSHIHLCGNCGTGAGLPPSISFFRCWLSVNQYYLLLPWADITGPLEAAVPLNSEEYLFNNYLCVTSVDRLCGLVVRVSDYRPRGPGFDSRPYQIFWEIRGLERGPLSLLRTTEELLEWKSSDYGLENQD